MCNPREPDLYKAHSNFQMKQTDKLVSLYAAVYPVSNGITRLYTVYTVINPKRGQTVRNYSAGSIKVNLQESQNKVKM